MFLEVEDLILCTSDAKNYKLFNTFTRFMANESENKLFLWMKEKFLQGTPEGWTARITCKKSVTNQSNRNEWRQQKVRKSNYICFPLKMSLCCGGGIPSFFPTLSFILSA